MARRYPTKQEAAERGFLDKTALRAQRLKPAPSTPYLAYWQGQGFVTAYLRRDCVPMRPKRDVTPAQLEAMAAGRRRRRRQELEELSQEEARSAAWRKAQDEELALKRDIRANAASWLQAQPVFIDTETTGLDASDEVIEIAVLDQAGQVLLHSLVRPSVPISEGAAAVHSIAQADVAMAPAWPEVHARINAVLHGRLVVGHNAPFEQRMLAQTCRVHGLAEPEPSGWSCTMELLTPLNGWRYPCLQRALALASAPVEDLPPAHRAPADAERCRRLVMALALRKEGIQ